MKMKERVFSGLLTFIMVVCLYTPINVMAADVLTTKIDEAEIQKYGNVPLALKYEELLDAGYSYGDILNVAFLNQKLELPLCGSFSDVDSGTPAVFASDKSGTVILAINMGDFATDYGVAVKNTAADGTVTWSLPEGVTEHINVSISMNKAGGYYDEYILHHLSYTNERADYPDLSDEQFANFRMVTTTGIGAGRLYRSSSPLNPENNRNKYADAAYKKAGINVIMNLVDSESELKAYEGYSSTYYSNQKYVALKLSMDFTSEDFKAGLAKGLRFFAENPGVYAVHCTEGKDRSGFVVAVIECLMGASYDEVISDYMVTFFNYYGITPDDPRYNTVADSNISKSLARAFGVSDIKSADLSGYAENFIKSLGLSDEEIAKLKANLGGTAVSAADESQKAAESKAAETSAGEDKAPETAALYIVKSGDYLRKIAKEQLGDSEKWAEIYDFNKDMISDPNLIYAGQGLKLAQ